jgi:hypothetical protein
VIIINTDSCFSQPSKRKSFVASLIPSIQRVINVNDETIQVRGLFFLNHKFLFSCLCPFESQALVLNRSQETLAKCMEKFSQALGLFFSDSETNGLQDAFIRNMVASSPVIRRTATDAIIAICKGSRRPLHYLDVCLAGTVYHITHALSIS